MLRALDEAPLSRPYKRLALAVMLGAVLEFFDFFLIAFIVPVLDDEWNLTFGEAAWMLLAAGLGAILGSILWGRFGDRYGRKQPLVWGIVLFSVPTGVLALAPDDGWWFVSIFRFIVGMGVGGVAAVAVPLLLEFTPTRYRSRLVGLLTTALIPVAVLIAALSVALLEPLVGWRVLFAIGLAPLGLAVYVARHVPESARWLLDQGRVDEARDVVAWMLEMDPAELPPEPEAPVQAQPEGGGLRELLRYRRSMLVTSLAWFGAGSVAAGVVLWGPTFLETLLEIDEDEAALLFAFVTLGSFAGRLAFSFLPERIGRRPAGMLMGFCAAPLLVLAGLSGDSELAGVSIFLLFVIAAIFFSDGGFANLVAYTPETFPTRLRARGMGYAQAINGLGRFIGPLGVALIAGTGNTVEPEATADALAPAFIFLAGLALVIGVAFLLFGIETHGKDLDTLEAELEAGAPADLALE